MLEFLTAEQNLPFTVALAVMLGIAVLEGLMTLIGFGLSNAIESMLPDMNMDADLHVHLDADLHTEIHGDIDSPTALSHLLSWLRVGEVPVLMLFVVFLTAFGLIGIGMQGFIRGLSGHMLPALVVSVPAVLLSLPVVRVMGSIIARIMPQDETEAVSHESLIGRIATLTIGTASKGHPAEARVRDVHGTMHYVMVEPDIDESFTRGDQVILVSQVGSSFKVIKNTSSSLVDE
ncbi:MAG: YqiJ family protein [Gammaproteobacteria bacterium]|nr:YqiJ family protein [Gammaproteobacteria bacterium]